MDRSMTRGEGLTVLRHPTWRLSRCSRPHQSLSATAHLTCHASPRHTIPPITPSLCPPRPPPSPTQRGSADSTSHPPFRHPPYRHPPYRRPPSCHPPSSRPPYRRPPPRRPSSRRPPSRRPPSKCRWRVWVGAWLEPEAPLPTVRHQARLLPRRPPPPLPPHRPVPLGGGIVSAALQARPPCAMASEPRYAASHRSPSRATVASHESESTPVRALTLTRSPKGAWMRGAVRGGEERAIASATAVTLVR